MKILIVSPFENTQTKRGNRNVLIYKRLIAEGHDVDFLTSNFDHALKQKIELKNFTFEKVVEVYGYKENISFFRLYTHMQFAYKSKKSLADCCYDIVFLSSIPPEVGFIFQKKNIGKMVVDVRDIWPDALLGYKNKIGFMKRIAFYYFDFLNKSLAKKVDYAFIVANGYKQWLDRYGIKKYSFFPLGFRNGESPELSATVDKRHALYAGGLTPQFDISNMANILSKHGIIVNVYGSGSLESVYKNIKNIKIHGVVSRSTILDEMKISNYLLFPKNEFALLPNKAFDYYSSMNDVLFEPNVSSDVKELFDNIKPWKDGLYISEASTRNRNKCSEFSQEIIIKNICEKLVSIL